MCGRGPLRGIASSSALEEPELKLSSCSLKQPHRAISIGNIYAWTKKAGGGLPQPPP